MKNLNFLWFFLALFSFSQEFNDKLKNSRMGLYIAPAVNFIQTDSDQIEANSNLGVVYGYALEIGLNQNHYIESGFSVSYKGGGLTQIQENENVNANYKIEYITLPFFIKMRSRKVGYFNYFARIGPSLNFKIKENISSNEKAKGAVVDISIFLGTEYSLGGRTSLEGSFFFTNNITNSLMDNQIRALFHQIGVRIGFLF